MKTTFSCIIISILLYACQLNKEPKNIKTANDYNPRELIERENTAYNTLNALATLELSTLNDYVLADSGLTISSFRGGAYTFPKEVLRTYSKKDTTKYFWGEYDGSLDDINLSLKDYINTNVYNEDFLNVRNLDIVKALQENKSFYSNTNDYLLSEHPEYFVKSFHYPFNDDWKIIDVIMTAYQGKWYLKEIRLRCWTI